MTVLDRAEAYWRVTDYDPNHDRLTDLSGNGHHAVRGSVVGPDTNDPTMLVHGGEQYLYLPGVDGNFASTPTAVALDPSDDIEIRVDIALDDYSPVSNQRLFARYLSPGNHRQFTLSVTSGGSLSLGLGAGDGTFRVNLSVSASGLTDGQRYQFRITLDADNGSSVTEVKFYQRAPTEALDADMVAWTQLGSTQIAVGVQSWKAVTAELQIGAQGGASNMTGKVYRALYWKDLTKTTLAFDADFTQQATPESDTFTEGSPNAATVTINRSATGLKSSVVERDKALFGIDDFFLVANHPNLNIALADPFTVIYAGRTYAPQPASNEAFIAKKTGLGNTPGWAIFNQSAGTAWVAQLSDGVASIFDNGATIVAGALTVFAAVRDRAADDLEVFDDGVGSGSPIPDTLTASLANANGMFIGAVQNGNSHSNSEYFASAFFREALPDADVLTAGIELLFPPPAGFLPPGWGGPAAPPAGTGPPGGAASGAPTGTAPIYGGIDVAARARQLADAVCDGVIVAARGQQGIAFSLVQLLHCLQGRGVPHAPQSAERSLELIFRELGVARPHNVTLAQELDIIAAHLP